ncbi:carbonic anhydrase [Glycomyces buryatensis]|uniref:Carbonic anhydrase n=1 Tax=Glycomyces buryatensis TaxID=2570927 RepID=A0A4S8Q8T3_9ACTN|nr:carbonic anhydrase [Glycomyces buryatensis]THV40813.1 carbonic anhydrase [Glycomyces buryatensis]
MVNNSLKSSRRGLISGIGAVGLGAALTACSADDQGGQGGSADPTAASTDAAATTTPPTTATEAWDRLVEGNARWAAGEATHPNTTPESREALLDTQSPWAIVFGCVDSRVAPELVFDTGNGELMIVRTAGSTFDELVAESVVYGPLAIGTPLVVVLGHQHCGAVTHAYEALHADAEDDDPFDEIVEAIEPAYEAIEDTGEEETDVEAMIRANVLLVVEDLKKQPEFADPIANGLEIVGAYYSIETGLVERVE